MYYKSEDLKKIGEELGKVIHKSNNPNLYISLIFLIFGVPIALIIGFYYF